MTRIQLDILYHISHVSLASDYTTPSQLYGAAITICMPFYMIPHNYAYMYSLIAMAAHCYINIVFSSDDHIIMKLKKTVTYNKSLKVLITFEWQ